MSAHDVSPEGRGTERAVDVSPERRGTERAVAVPAYRRAGLWFAFGVLLGVAAVLLHVYGLFPARHRAEAPAPPVVAAPAEADDAQARLERLRAAGRGLEDEVLRLKNLLREDPCASPELPGIPAPEGPATTAPESVATPAGRDGASAGSGGNASPASPSGPARPPAAMPAGIVDLLTGATVFIVSSHNDTVGLGSGFFVAPGIVATNRHVVGSPQARVVVGNKVLGGMRRADVVAFSADEDRDFALLKVDGRAPATPVLRIARGAERTERVSAWGFPGYITAIDPKLSAMVEGDIESVPDVVYSEGVVSVVLDRVPPVILHTAALSQGNSGGPLVDASGAVAGVNTFIRRADQSYSQTNIALPGSELAAFMRANGFKATEAQ